MKVTPGSKKSRVHSQESDGNKIDVSSLKLGRRINNGREDQISKERMSLPVI